MKPLLTDAELRMTFRALVYFRDSVARESKDDLEVCQSTLKKFHTIYKEGWK